MQLSIFDTDPVELEIYDSFSKHELPYEIEKYKMYRQYEELMKYLYVKTKCGALVDICIRADDNPVIFEIYDNLDERFINSKVMKGART